MDKNKENKYRRVKNQVKNTIKSQHQKVYKSLNYIYFHICSQVAQCAFVLLLMAVYWMTEVIPLSMTAMLPAILFPFFGIMRSSDVSPSDCQQFRERLSRFFCFFFCSWLKCFLRFQVAKEYFKDFHVLLVGVICLATSIEKWGLHRRIALRLVTMVGVNPAW